MEKNERRESAVLSARRRNKTSCKFWKSISRAWRNHNNFHAACAQVGFRSRNESRGRTGCARTQMRRIPRARTNSLVCRHIMIPILVHCAVNRNERPIFAMVMSKYGKSPIAREQSETRTCRVAPRYMSPPAPEIPPRGTTIARVLIHK